MPDMPPDEAGPLKGPAAALGSTNFSTCPHEHGGTTGICGAPVTGFVYYVSLTGITGAKLLNMADVIKNVEKIRKVTHVPVAVGFGVATPEDAARVSAMPMGDRRQCYRASISLHNNQNRMVKHVAEFVRSWKVAMTRLSKTR